MNVAAEVARHTGTAGRRNATALAARHPGAGPARRWRLLAAALAVFCCGVWAWASGLHGPYHFDDHLTPRGDPASESLAAWGHYLPVTLRPVTKLSYALEADAAWSDRPAPRRAVSLLLHALSAGVLYLLVARLQAGAAASWCARSVAALWFLHPVHADSVLLLSGRSALLSGLLLLTAMLVLEQSRRWLAALLFALACLSRETALAGLLPLAVLALSRPGVSWRAALRSLAPALLAAIVVSGWLLTTPRYLQLAEYSFRGRPFWPSLSSQVGAVPVGLRLLLTPAATSIDYGLALPARITAPLFLLGAALYAAAAFGIVVLLRRSRMAALGLALWLAALLPTQSIVPKLDALSNRPLSLALAGLLMIVAVLLAALQRQGALWSARVSRQERRIRPAGYRRAALGGGAALCAWLAMATADRATLFQSELSLWQDAASKSQVNPRPHLQYARLLMQAEQIVEARAALRAAQRIDPFSADVAAFTQAWFPREISR
ncbi:MAG: hypothetical protein IT480_13560 [Gammaproteobacteria bacterium]|nr:hypothetical protein [Gammaproteobacteria bacterium]